ncbi:MAG: LON peptidase substrate-binding domain-containing protein, partial [Bacteroides sp.]|nr:LON peptidase substrate-binding domain-containing protein [Bacteroides sp.]
MNNIFNDNFLDSNDCKVTIGPIITEIRDVSDTEMEHTDFDNIPLLPLRDMVLFPGVTSPISIGREASLALIN